MADEEGERLCLLICHLAFWNLAISKSPSHIGIPSGMPTTPTVAHTLACVGCGYDLVGLAEDGVCPECGVSIGRSISGDHLLASSRAHRLKLAEGARLAVLGAWAGWLSLGLLAVDVLVGLALPASRGRAWPLIVAQVPLWLALAATMTLTGLGWVALTREDPDRVGGSTRGWAWRMLLRGWAAYAVFVGVVVLPLYLIVSITDAAFGWPTGPEVARTAAMFGWPVLALSGTMAVEISTLARRLLEGDLAGRTRLLAVAGWTAFGLLAARFTIGTAVLAFLLFFTPWQFSAWPMDAVLGVFVSVAVLAWAIQYHTLVRALRAALVHVVAGP